MLPLVLAAVPATAPIQGREPVWRFEVADRIRHVEFAWSRCTSPEKRRLAVEQLGSASKSLSENRFGDAARALDQASAELGYVRLGGGYGISPRKRLCDPDEIALSIDLVRLYGDSEDRNLWGTALGGWFLDEKQNRMAAADGDPELLEVPWEGRFSLIDAREGDRRANLWIWADSWPHASTTLTLSVVPNARNRLEALREQIQGLPSTVMEVDGARLRGALELLEDLLAGDGGEIDVPAALLLNDAERIVASAKLAQPGWLPNEPGDRWVFLAGRDRGVPARRWFGEGEIEASTPLVIALHGEFADESSWFEHCGEGALLKLCRERGWLLVAPRVRGSDDVGAVDAAVACAVSRLGSEPAPIFLVGHGPGALVALTAIQATPRRFEAVVVVGAGPLDVEPEKLGASHILLAVGEHDPAVPVSKRMHDALASQLPGRVQLVVVPGTEHWMAVQEALPGVFAWLDERVK